MRVQSPFSANLSAQLWDEATFQVAEHEDAMRYGWLGGICAALALVFLFMWVATGQKAFAWYFGTVLVAVWRIGENSGLLPAMLPWSGHTLATVSHVVADAALLFFTLGLVLHAIGKQPSIDAYRRVAYGASVPGVLLIALAPWPALAAAVPHGAIAVSYGVLVFICAGLAIRG